ENLKRDSAELFQVYQSWAQSCWLLALECGSAYTGSRLIFRSPAQSTSHWPVRRSWSFWATSHTFSKIFASVCESRTQKPPHRAGGLAMVLNSTERRRSNSSAPVAAIIITRSRRICRRPCADGPTRSGKSVACGCRDFQIIPYER